MSDSDDEIVQVELAAWAQIQRKTFTRWVNQQLKIRDIIFEDLQFGFKDGTNLINLVELLIQKETPTKYNRKPRIKMQMVENLGIALGLLTNDGIKLVNIGNEDIYVGNMKLILGLIWTLILHYQISADYGNKTGDSDVSAKKDLMNWATNLVNSLPDTESKVKNFTTDWNDGIALCCMVEAVAPGLCPEYASLDPKNKLENARLGLDRAEQGLGVPKIIEAEDLINPIIDELSVLTYVSLLRNAAPQIELKPSDPLKVRIYGPGTETAWINTPTEFCVDTTDAGYGTLKVEIKDKDGNVVPVEQWNKDNDIKVQYTPITTGTHKFRVTYNGTTVPDGKFKVKVLAPSDASKVTLSGDGMDKAVVGKLAYFICDTSDAGDGNLEVAVVGTDGEVPVEIESLEPLVYKVSYTPVKAGPTRITVKYGGSEVPASPLHVEVIDPLKVKIISAGLDNLVAKEPVRLIVCTKDAGDGKLRVKILDDDDQPLKVKIVDVGDDYKEARFTPDHHGNHHVSVTWSGKPVPEGEIDVEVAKPLDLTACIVTGLKNPVVGHPTNFTVDVSKVGSDDLKVEILNNRGNPLETSIEKIDDGVFGVEYIASEAVPYKVNVTVEDQHVKGSAYTVYGVDPLKVIVEFDKDKVYIVDEPVEVALLMSDAGPGELGIQLSAPANSGTDCHAKEISPGKMMVVFTPNSPGEHRLNLTFDDKEVPSTPIVIQVLPKANAKAVTVDGDGIRDGFVGKTAIFTINTSEAGPGDLDVKISGPNYSIPITPVEIADGLHEVVYTPQEEGPHVVAVKFADQHVPGSAFRPNMRKITSPNDVVAYGKGLEEGTLGNNSEFYVDTSKGGEGDLDIVVEGPTVLEPEITKLTDNNYKVVYAVPKEGDYKISIKWSGSEAPTNISMEGPTKSDS